MMATFHEMKDEQGQGRGALPDQGRTGPAARPRCAAPSPDDLTLVAVERRVQQRYMAENERLASQGLRVLATGRKDFDARSFDPTRRPAADASTA